MPILLRRKRHSVIASFSNAMEGCGEFAPDGQIA